MSRNASFRILVGTVLVVGTFFFYLIRPFLFPLLFAAVLALLFRPWYNKVKACSGGHDRLAAVATALSILALVVAPVVVASICATRELIQFSTVLVRKAENSTDPELRKSFGELKERLTSEEFATLRQAVSEGKRPTSVLSSFEDAEVYDLLVDLEYRFPRQDVQKVFDTFSVSDIVEPQNSLWMKGVVDRLQPHVSREDLQRIGEASRTALQKIMEEVYEKTRSFVANAVSFVIGFAIMALALYYFLAEGPQILRVIEAAAPMENADLESLFTQFDKVCRGVVLGTLVAAIVQGVLVAIALAILGIRGIFLLAALTMLLSLIPFLGAAAVYLPVSAYLIYQGRFTAAFFLAAYGVAFVSTTDNVIRAFLIHGSSRLHPLLALVSMLGGLKVIGLWGIFVGPLVAAFFYALLTMLQQKLEPSSSAGDG